MNANQKALWDRWQGFLGKIEARQAEIFQEAEEGLREIMAAHPEDYQPYGNALTGIRFRLDELRTKVDETWSEQVEPKFEEASDDGFLDQGLDSKQDFLRLLDERWTAFEAHMEAEYYRQLYPRAVAAAQKPMHCVHCGAELQLPQRHEPVSLPCPYCRAVNQIIPDAAISNYYGGGPHAFACEAALPLRHAVERYRIEVDRWRRARSWAPETAESLEKWEAMESAYWQKYAEVRSQISGQPQDREFYESRMRQFRETALMTNQIYRKARGL